MSGHNYKITKGTQQEREKRHVLANKDFSQQFTWVIQYLYAGIGEHKYRTTKGSQQKSKESDMFQMTKI